MEKDSKIYVAGHRGMVGSVIVRKLNEKGYTNIITKTHKELDLTRQKETEEFFEKERPDYVFLAAAKVGGILANNTYKADFIYENIMIAANIINSAYKYKVKKLLNFGSSCIYPKFAKQPMKEEYLLTGSLEPTNEPYAIAKISAIKLCRYFNEQYNTNFISIMPTNLYGINDNFHLFNSHVLPALIRKMYLAKLLENNNFKEIIDDFRKNNDNFISDKMEDNTIVEKLKEIGIYKENSKTILKLWGSGKPYREFLYVDDLAEGAIFLMENYNYSDIGEFVNIGVGKDIKIKKLAFLIRKIVGFTGDIYFDKTKPDGTPRKLLDISKIKRLGWGPKISLEEGIKNVFTWYLNK